MQRGSIVVLESEAAWPAWVDQEAGVTTRIVVLGRRRREPLRDFESRARARLQALVEGGPPRRGLLVCGPGAGRGELAVRAGLAKALVEIVYRSGGGEVVLMGEVGRALAAELAGRVHELNREPGGPAPVSIRQRLPPRVDREALRVA